jgi:hypothetical protein
MRMSYQYDVFISYRQEPNVWTRWARETFTPNLRACLQPELGFPPTIFIDEETPIGVNFPRHLAASLARSKVLVALLSKDYFCTDWCVHELDLMMERAAGNTLIIPVIVQDGKAIPDEVAALQSADFVDYRNPGICPKTLLDQRYWDDLIKLSRRIGEAVEAAPEFDSKWETVFEKRLRDVYVEYNKHGRVPGNRVQPQTFKLKATAPKNITPRLRI